MQNVPLRGLSARSLLVAVIGAGVIGWAANGWAARSNPANECLAGFDDVPEANVAGGLLKCTDCDPACDTDGAGTANQTCTFQLSVCGNLPSETCEAGDLKKLKAKSKCGQVTLTPSGTSSVCGSFTGTVKLKKPGRRAGKCKVMVMAKVNGRPKRMDADKLTLQCDPLPSGSSCPTTSTTTTSTTSTTSTTLAVCGNGVIETGETCDPPCQANGECTGGTVCRSDCQGCITPAPCDAGACGSPVTQLSFITSPPDVGTRSCIGGTNDGNACVTLDQCPGGACSNCLTSDGTITGTVTDAANNVVCNLRSGGLYFGGSGDAVPLPAAVPDLGNSLLNVGCCQDDGLTMQLLATSDTDTGANPRNCTSGTVVNPEYPPACNGGPNPGMACTSDADCAPGVCFEHTGCLFGPPLPIPNASGPSISTCVINRVAKNASGTAHCSTGEASISLPLVSDLYLTGDYLDGSAPDRPAIVGIQPCPLCTGTAGSETCKGGPRNGMACTPGGTDLGGEPAYPTSHDCPPPPSAFIGPLDIPFALTTGTTSDTSADSAAQDRIFCGFCGGGVQFHNPPVSCDSDADCVGLSGCGSAEGPCTTCKQRQAGAFQIGDARTITQTGSPAGPLGDHASHTSTLVSVFCIPPSFNGAVDGTADLPGPGAVALPGSSRLLP
jgi:hypothetical protein